MSFTSYPVSRRGVLGAAWTAPVIVAVSAAPTFAASGSPAVSATLTKPVRLLIGRANSTSGSRMPLVSTLVNSGNGPAEGLQVQIRVQIPTGQALSDMTADEPPVDGFSFVSTVYSETVAVFTFLAAAPLAAGSEVAFRPTMSFSSSGGQGDPGTIQIIPVVVSGTSTPSMVQSYT